MIDRMHYRQGARHALLKLGMSPDISADMFAEFAEQDQTSVDSQSPNGPENPPAIAKGVDKTPAWSGQNSLESGDAGTRNYQLGVPRAGGV